MGGFRVDACARRLPPPAPTPIPRVRDIVITTRPVQKVIKKRLRPRRKVPQFSSYAQGLGSACPPRGQPLVPKPNHRAKNSPEVIPKCPPVRKTIRKRPPRQNPAPQPLQHNVKTTHSVLDMLCQRNSGSVAAPGAPQQASRQASEPKVPIEKVTQYIEQLQRAITEGRVDLRGDPWIVPSNPFQEAVAINAQRKRDGERQINAIVALNLILRPKVFAGAPE